MTRRASAIDPEYIEFGKKVKSILQDMGMSEAAFSRKTGISQHTINLICRGKQLPTIKLAVEIARYLDISLDEIFDLQERKNG